MIDWSSVDTVFLDMDGTLLDLHFDTYFWLTHLPMRYAQLRQIPERDARELIVPMIRAEQGSLNWYCTDFWSERLALNVTDLKAEVRERIGYRPHTKAFLAALREASLPAWIVTNCHPDPLALKFAETGLDTHVNGVVSSHELGYPKESAEFWRALAGKLSFDPARTLMVDDSFPVLESAHRAGIGQCLAVLAPDSQEAPRKAHDWLPGIHDFDEVIPDLRSGLKTRDIPIMRDKQTESGS